MKINWTDEMGEISGFGGGYEKGCRDMIDAALTWLEENPEADPQFTGYKNVYGVISEDNEDAKALSKAATDVCDDCTGAMHQAVISNALWINKHSLEEWMKERENHDNQTN